MYEGSLRTKLKKTCKKPDAVYGLRKTERIERLLWAKDKRPGSGGEIIKEIITSTPFRRDAPTTFPFLVSESKSEKAVESQMAFVIRSLLNFQENLCKTTGEDTK